MSGIEMIKEPLEKRITAEMRLLVEAMRDGAFKDIQHWWPLASWKMLFDMVQRENGDARAKNPYAMLKRGDIKRVSAAKLSDLTAFGKDWAREYMPRLTNTTQPHYVARWYAEREWRLTTAEAIVLLAGQATIEDQLKLIDFLEKGRRMDLGDAEVWAMACRLGAGPRTAEAPTIEKGDRVLVKGHANIADGVYVIGEDASDLSDTNTAK